MSSSSAGSGRGRDGRGPWRTVPVFSLGQNAPRSATVTNRPPQEPPRGRQGTPVGRQHPPRESRCPRELVTQPPPGRPTSCPPRVPHAPPRPRPRPHLPPARPPTGRHYAHRTWLRSCAAWPDHCDPGPAPPHRRVEHTRRPAGPVPVPGDRPAAPRPTPAVLERDRWSFSRRARPRTRRPRPRRAVRAHVGRCGGPYADSGARSAGRRSGRPAPRR